MAGLADLGSYIQTPQWQNALNMMMPSQMVAQEQAARLQQAQQAQVEQDMALQKWKQQQLLSGQDAVMKGMQNGGGITPEMISQLAVTNPEAAGKLLELWKYQGQQKQIADTAAMDNGDLSPQAQPTTGGQVTPKANTGGGLLDIGAFKGASNVATTPPAQDNAPLPSVQTPPEAQELYNKAELKRRQAARVVGLPQHDDYLAEATRLEAKADKITSRVDELAKEQRSQQGQTDKMRKEATISGYELNSDSLPTSTNVTQAQQFAALVPAYESALKDVKEKIAKYGSTTGWGTDTKEVDQSMNQLMQLERTINATGVLNLGEKPILEESYATFDPRSVWNLTKSKDEMKQAADDYLSLRKNMINAKLKGFGYTPKNGDISNPSKESVPKAAMDLGITTPEQWGLLSEKAKKELLNGQ